MLCKFQINWDIFKCRAKVLCKRNADFYFEINFFHFNFFFNLPFGASEDWQKFNKISLGPTPVRTLILSVCPATSKTFCIQVVPFLRNVPDKHDFVYKRRPTLLEMEIGILTLSWNFIAWKYYTYQSFIFFTYNLTCLSSLTPWVMRK